MATRRSYKQSELLTTRIRNLLNEYPTGAGPFSEFLQNADDAGARNFSLILDENNYSTEKILSPGLSHWQGPSLLVYNDATFSEADFENLHNLGDSEKLEDNTRIGKYGLGFNVSYHFTDVVSFLSNEWLTFLDPHEKYLPEGKETGGFQTCFREEKDDDILDHLKPFSEVANLFGKNIDNKLDATIFRLPFRTTQESLICPKSTYDVPGVTKVLYDFREQISSMILFLKNVENISIWIFRKGEKINIFDLKVSNVTHELRQKRNCLKLSQNPKLERPLYLLQIEKEFLVMNIKQETEYWLVIQGGLENEKLEKELNSFFWGGVALKLNESCDVPVGNVYSFLVLPVSSNLPVSINGNFALSSNRRHLWAGEDLDAEGLNKKKWNDQMNSKLIPDLYIQLLQFYLNPQKSNDVTNDIQELAKNNKIIMDYSFKYFPNKQTVLEPFNQISDSFYDCIYNRKTPIFQDSNQNWNCLQNLHLETEVSKTSLGQTLRNHLERFNFNTIDLPKFIKKSLNKDHYTKINQKVVTDFIKTYQENCCLNIESAVELVSYVLGSVDYWDFETAAKHFEWLNGIQCIPLASNELAIFYSNSNQQTLVTSSNVSIDKILPNFPFIISKDNTIYSILCKIASNFPEYTNISNFTTKMISQNISYMLPSNMKDRGSCLVSGETLVRMKKFWEFCGADINLDDFSRWPIFLLHNSKACSKNYITSNQILVNSDFSEQERDFLSEFGCEFLLTNTETIGSLTKTKNYVVSILVSKTKNIKLTQEQCEKLAKCLFKNRRYIVKSVGQLPIFKNTFGTYKYLDNHQFICPDQKWESILNNEGWSNLLSAKTPQELHFLNSVQKYKMNLSEFLQYKIIPQLANLQASTIVEFLKDSISCGLQNNISNSLRNVQLVVYEDGSRKTVNQCTNPTDSFSKIFPEHQMLPPIYCTPAIISFFEKIGLICSTNPSSFEGAANLVAASQNEKHSKILTDLLTSNQYTERPFYTKISSRVGDVAFILGKDYPIENSIELPTLEDGCYPTFEHVKEQIDPDIVWISLKDGAKIKDTFWLWRIQYVLPFVFSDGFCKHFNINDVTQEEILQNFEDVIRDWKAKDLLKQEEKENIIYAYCTKFQTFTGNLKSKLSNLEWILIDSTWHKPSDFALGIEADCDIGLKIPKYLKRFKELFSETGALESKDNFDFPRKPETSSSNVLQPNFLLEQFQKNFNSKSNFTDVKFIVGDHEIRCHKVVLGFGSDHFKAMFNVDMKKDNQNGTTVVKVPDWLHYDALTVFLKYFYFGELEGLQGEHKKTSESTEIVLNLLRISDYYQEKYVHQFCQHWLGDLAILRSTNIISLFSQAHISMASELERVATQYIRTISKSIKQQPEWKDLSQDLKFKIFPEDHVAVFSQKNQTLV